MAVDSGARRTRRAVIGGEFEILLTGTPDNNVKVAWLIIQ